MKTKDLTIKQEAFCQAFILLGDKSAAYREAYSCGNMKAETIHVRASKLSNEYKLSTRIAILQQELKERNNVTVDEIVSSLADMLRFDVADLYDENGSLKDIHSIPKKARLMISELTVDELKGYEDGKSVAIGQTKKIKLFDKLQAVEKLMKHLGGYEKDNKQKGVVVIDTEDYTPEKEARIKALKEKLLASGK